MNSRHYRIGFLMAIFLLSLLYIFSDLWFRTDQREVQANEETIYYLKEEEGTISIYLDDGQRLYEKTAIPVKILPAALQKEIQEGTCLSGEEELFSFLENYSS